MNPTDHHAQRSAETTQALLDDVERARLSYDVARLRQLRGSCYPAVMDAAEAALTWIEHQRYEEVASMRRLQQTCDRCIEAACYPCPHWPEAA